MQCTASNRILTVDYSGPIANSGIATGTIDGDQTSISGEISDDQTRITFDMGAAGLDPYYYGTLGETYFTLYPASCDTSFTWSDNFLQVSYADDEGNTLDLSAFESPIVFGPDTGTCRECGWLVGCEEISANSRIHYVTNRYISQY